MLVMLVTMEVFCFVPSVPQTVQGQRKKTTQALLKSLIDLVLACLTPVYCSVSRAVGRRKHHKVPSKWSGSNCECGDAWKSKDAF